MVKMGWHCSDTAMIRFEDVRVPRANLIGEENQVGKLSLGEGESVSAVAWQRCTLKRAQTGFPRDHDNGYEVDRKMMEYFPLDNR